MGMVTISGSGLKDRAGNLLNGRIKAALSHQCKIKDMRPDGCDAPQEYFSYVADGRVLPFLIHPNTALSPDESQYRFITIDKQGNTVAISCSKAISRDLTLEGKDFA